MAEATDVTALLAVVDDLRRAAQEADGQDPLDEAATLHLKHRGLEGTGVWTEGEDGRDGVALRRGDELDLVVHPQARRRGVGTRLAEQALAEPGPVAAWSHGNHPGAARLAAAHGLERARDLWVMRRPTHGPDAVPLPPVEAVEGVTLRTWADHDAGPLLRVNAAAFAHHPEQGGMDRDELVERMGEDWFDPAGLILAVEEDTDALLGFHWTKQHSTSLGEVYVVGISPGAQGRGLGTTLTLAGLHHLAGRGIEQVLLYVESDNAPAVAVYRRLGFAHADEDTHVMYRR